MSCLFLLCVLLPLLTHRSETASSSEKENRRVSHDPDIIAFLLYNDPVNRSFFRPIVYGNAASLITSGFNPLKRTIFLIHGFNSNPYREFPQEMKNEFLKATDGMNLIIVDWRNLASPIPHSLSFAMYPKVMENVPVVAERLGLFITFIREVYDPSAVSKIHMIGHCMGAHIAGIAARSVRTRDGILVDRVTGLDPAGPLFFPVISRRNLLPTDARLVDVYHTNMGMQGTMTEDGSVNAYINGGILQPGCTFNDTDVVRQGALGLCSHNFSHRLYTRSISHPFIGCDCMNLSSLTGQFARVTCTGRPNDCPSSAALGYHITSNARGLYYVNTA